MVARSSVVVLLPAVFAVLTSAGASRAQINALAPSRSAVGKYQLTWDLSYNEEVPAPNQPMVSYTYRGSSTGTAVLTGVNGVYEGSGTSSGTAYLRETFHLEDGDFWEESDCAGSDVPTTFIGRFVIRGNDRYDLALPASYFPGTARNSTGYSESIQIPPEIANIEDQPVGHDPGITFSGTVQHQVATGATIGIHVTATLSPLGKPPKLNLLPTVKGIPDPSRPAIGKVIRVGGGDMPVPIRFILEEVTSEPGICLNGPDANTAPDLDFNMPNNAAAFKTPEAVGSNGWRMETRQPGVNAICQIGVRDWGPWGKLRAEAFYEGSWHAIPVKGSRAGYTTVPLDENGNKISDDWEKKYHLKNPAGGSDQEKKPQGDGTTKGDGFSTYEEYRGLIVHGSHRSLNPNVKDLVVENQAGADADPGLSLFESASGFGVVRLDSGELSSGRVANERTSGLFHNGDQHGLRLVFEAIGGGTIGEAVPIALHNKHPVDCTLVRVDPAGIQATTPPGQVAAETASTIAHELAHGIGVEHHGDPVTSNANRDILSADTNYKIYGSDGGEITTRPYHLTGRLGGPHNDASGDTSCVMCYTSEYQWCVIPPNGPNFSIYAVKPPVRGTRFCTSPKGTGMNADGKYFGDATRGNCLKQMRVKDY